MIPRVSILIINLNGSALLSDCLTALQAQSYPAKQIEIILVDNGSTDDSVAFVRKEFPEVRVIEVGRNLGFAGGNNLAARHARGKYLALINNDAVAEPEWLAALMHTIEVEQVACVASKMLSWDGTRVDFAGGVMNIYGRAFGLDEGWKANGYYNQPSDLFFACGGAMLIQRDIFLELKGFDERFMAYFEDVDLGWRLWLAGHRVRFEAKAVVRHRGQTTGKRFPVEQRYMLSEANALRMIIQNYEDKILWRVLPLSLLLCAKRSVYQARLDVGSYELGAVRDDALPMGSEAESDMSRVATGMLVAMAQIADEMPKLMARRAEIQANRKRTDEEIFRRFPPRADNPLFPWRTILVAQGQLAESLEVPQVIRPVHRSRLLIITHEKVGQRMAGPAIRAWQIAHALGDTFEVVLACPTPIERTSSTVRLADYSNEMELELLIASVDVVLAMGSLFSRFARLRDLNKPTIIDLYDPFELEKLAMSHTISNEWKSTVDYETVRDIATQSQAGDFFICASERQRNLWLGTLLASGRLNTLTYANDPEFRHLIDVVPFGISAEPLVKQRQVLKGVHPGIATTDRVLLWGGGLWEWFDPLTLLEALAQVIKVRPEVKLFFAAGHHFDESVVPTMPILAQVHERAAALGILDQHVFFGNWIPYDKRGDYLLEADIGVSTHKRGIETNFASRTRLLDYVWAGLPILTSAGDPLAEEVAKRGVGKVIMPGDVNGVIEGIYALLADDVRTSMQSAFEQWRKELQWSSVVKPLVDFLRKPHLSSDAAQTVKKMSLIEQMRKLERQTVALEKQIVALEQVLEKQRQEYDQHIEAQRQGYEAQSQRYEQHLEAIRNGRVMRLLNFSRKIFNFGRKNQ